MTNKTIFLIYLLINISVLHAQNQNQLNKRSIDSLKLSTTTTKDEGFTFIYKNAEEINKIMGADDAEKHITYWITKEEIDPSVINADSNRKEPNWGRMAKTIRMKYNTYYSERTITGAKLRWYYIKKNGPAFAKFLIEYVTRYEGLTDIFRLSNNAWDVFLKTSNKSDLRIALGWCEFILSKEPDNAGVTDTYANIYYKLGDKQKALRLEAKALALDPNHAEIRSNYEKMLKGLKTWPEENN